ncbi:hypothetical protein BDW02DRAFT_55487 [Decorospora gaudefroyi]|uniref:Hydrophobin n=1 Tax=Decorospora gaudefroyi TaxID=184978 RepID=A0A6A5K1A2_9PLEO|nr:hypothetical protein BDW02DRAFT_55487 [Decorospora gaudefroyi]
MVLFHHLLLAACASLAAAYPEPTTGLYLNKRTTKPNCSKLNGALTILKKLGPPATSFCSSYLKIPATTTSVTTTTPVTTITTSTTTVLVTSSVCPDVRPPVQKKVIPGRRNPETEDVEKRTKVLLPLLAAFAAAKVSEGCKCLDISPRASITSTTTVAASVRYLTERTFDCDSS